MKNSSERESVKVGKASLFLGGAEVLNFVFGAFYFLVLTRTLSRMDMAAVAVMSIVMNLAAMFTGFGFHAAALKVIPEAAARGETERLRDFLAATWGLIAVASAAAAAIFLLGADFFGTLFFKQAGTGRLMAIIALSIPANKLYETAAHTMTAFQRFGEIGAAQILNNVLVRLYALALYFACGIEGYLLGLITGQAVVGLWLAFELRGSVGRRWRPGECRRWLRYSLPFYANGFIGYGAGQADSLIVGLFLKPEILATFYVAKRFVDFLEQFVGATLRPVGPKMVELGAQGVSVLEKVFVRSTRYLTLVLVPAVFFLAAVSRTLLTAYGRGRYIGGLPVLVVLSAAGGLAGFYALLMSAVFAAGKPIETTRIESARSAANILFGLCLIGPFGIVGAAVGKLLAQAAGVAAALGVGRRLMRFSMDGRFLARIAAVSAAAAAVVLAVQRLSPRSVVGAAGAAAGITVFLLLVRPLLSAGDRRLLGALVGGGDDGA